MYTIELSKPALKTLDRMPRNTAELIVAKIEELAMDPHAPNNNVTSLVGRPGHRLRVANWRVLYELDNRLRILAVERIAPRGGAYR